jgi:hypothetical protein
MRKLTVETLEPRNLLASIVMTPQEQLMLELVNRARAAPAAEASRFGIDLNKDLAPGTIRPQAKQPLAPHQILIQAAGNHSQDMLDRDFFAHVNPDGKSPTDRAKALGYVGGVGENISFGGSGLPIDQNAHVYQRHESLFRSAGHRANFLMESNSVVGVGIRYGVFTQNGVNYNSSMATQKFGASNSVFITGVVFTDSVRNDDFYDIGEEISDVAVLATASDGSMIQTVTGPSGGYAMLVPNGSYSLRFVKDGKISGSAKVVSVSSENVKVDYSEQFVNASSLHLSIDVSSFSEDGGENIAKLTIARDGLPSNVPLTVMLFGDATEIVLPTSVQIPANSNSVQIPIHAVDDNLLDGTVRVEVKAVAGSIESQPLAIDVLDAEALRISASLLRFSETAGGGISVLTISRSNTDISEPILVTLSSDDVSEVTVPPVVTIPAGQQNVLIGVTAKDDNLFDGTQIVHVTATSPKYKSAVVQFLVDDVQRLQIILQANFSLVEDDASLRHGHVTIALRSIAPEGGMNVDLEAEPLNTLALPSTVVVPEGHSQVTIPISLPPNLTRDGRRTARLKAKAQTMEDSIDFVILDSLADSWQNAANGLDADADGNVDPLDVLVVVNAINANGSRKLDNLDAKDRSLSNIDTNNDGYLDALDALGIVNFINARS